MNKIQVEKIIKGCGLSFKEIFDILEKISIIQLEKECNNYLKEKDYVISDIDSIWNKL